MHRSRSNSRCITVAEFENTFNEKEIAILHYSKKLTYDVGNLKKVDVIKLKQAGCDDGEILEGSSNRVF